MKNRKPKKQQPESLKRHTPRSEDPARLNDLNADQKPAPPQPPANSESQPAPNDQETVVELGGRPKQMIVSDAPTNPPHRENDGTLWATENESEAN